MAVEYVRSQDGRIKLTDNNIALYFNNSPVSVCHWKKDPREKYREKYKEMKREFREARDKGIVS